MCRLNNGYVLTRAVVISRPMQASFGEIYREKQIKETFNGSLFAYADGSVDIDVTGSLRPDGQ